MKPVKTDNIDRWVIGLAIMFILLWLAWLLKGVDIARAYLVMNIPIGIVSGTGATTQPPDASVYLQQLGQVGDLFGGFNALFAALACTGVVWAGSLQRQALIEAREAFEFERVSIREERAAVALNQFESTFFHFMELNRLAIESIRIEMLGNGDSASLKIPDRTGFDALEYLATVVYTRISTSPNWDDNNKLLGEALHVFDEELRTRRPSSLGLFFRLLFQTIKLIDNMPEALLNDQQKVKYSNIVRGQIPEGGVLLLALNGLAAHGQPLHELIERYGLLKYMPEKYLRLRNVLGEFYKTQAFLGFKERAKLKGGLIT